MCITGSVERARPPPTKVMPRLRTVPRALPHPKHSNRRTLVRQTHQRPLKQGHRSRLRTTQPHRRLRCERGNARYATSTRPAALRWVPLPGRDHRDGTLQYHLRNKEPRGYHDLPPPNLHKRQLVTTPASSHPVQASRSTLISATLCTWLHRTRTRQVRRQPALRRLRHRKHPPELPAVSHSVRQS